jgi:2-polyprenyl-6-methoxyphenol hydroxylase-like FAD-dependent oxidoreductase
MAAYWMARCGIKARIVDKRGHKVYNGHADGLRPRTEEIFDSMGGDLQTRIEAEGYAFESFRTWVRAITRYAVEDFMIRRDCRFLFCSFDLVGVILFS